MWLINNNCIYFKKTVSYSFICMAMTIFSSAKVWGAEETDEFRLRRNLLTGYDRNARPVQDHQNDTLVHVFIIAKGFEFDEESSVFSLHSLAILAWDDQHLKWNPRDYGNLTETKFAPEELWKPDLSVDNNFGRSEFTISTLYVYSPGHVIWVSSARFQVGCTSDLRKWPYDTQICYIVLASWAHDGGEINITVAPSTELFLTNMSWNREWNLKSNSLVKRTEYYALNPGNIPYVDVLITVVLERQSSTHSSATIVPALAISTAILIAFWIPPCATDRLFIILTVTLINALYLNGIYTSLPNNGDRVPLVLLFYRDSLFMVTVALIWTIVLRYLANTRRNAVVPLPNFITKFLVSWPAKILCLDPRPLTKENIRAEDGDDEGKLVDAIHPCQEDWTWLAHFLDRIAFVVYLLVYICFILAFL